MRVISECSQEEVLNYWRALYNYMGIFFRGDILERVTDDLQWYTVVIEEDDIDNIFIISSDDWGAAGITETYKVVDVVDHLERGISDDKIMPNILRKKREFEENINAMDRKFILISSTLDGNYTILDGNKRAVALQSINRLVGTEIYLGVSESVRRSVWTRYSN